MMRRFYTGLLFFGASFGTHAAETHKHAHAAKNAPVAMHYTQYVPEDHVHNSVVYADFKPADPLFSAPQSATTDRSAAALTQSQKNLVNILSALHYQRLSLQNEQLKLSFGSDSAVMETEHLKVAVQSDSTSITWHKTF
jgi:hypothetical protein